MVELDSRIVSVERAIVLEIKLAVVVNVDIGRLPEIRRDRSGNVKATLQSDFVRESVIAFQHPAKCQCTSSAQKNLETMQEIRQLRKQLQELEKENAFLKK